MQKNTSVTLGAHFEAFIARQLQGGRYASASEAVREGLRLLEEREAKLAALQRALQEGEESGEAVTLDMDKIKRNARRAVKTDG